ncbi:hypothetical protein [Actinoplanes sichuanensis]|uniref:Uncharacterized protein n=1 Tax=Actinoplanes sichuanensis TaxID=512349 RepID=A0ABW4A254_9ACTN|nr:hypothetical protein [Actinoplanes sichuanensis]
MIIFRIVVVTVLRERQHVRAAFVERELPEHIDTSEHGGLLAMLHLEPAASARRASL